MNNADNSSAGRSAATPPPPNADHDKNSASLSEAEFLAQEAARARAAIAGAFADLRKSVKSTVDPQALTRDHPWIAISTAAVAGFAAAVTLIPTKEQQALRALAELERARRAPPQPDAATSDKHEEREGILGGLFGTILAEALKTLRPLITTLITTSIKNAAGAGAPIPSDGAAAGSNGHSPDDQGEPEIPSPS